MNISYKTLHSTAIVSIRLPKNLSSVKVIKGEGDKVVAKFQQYAVNLPGGVVNVQAHSDKPLEAGKTIRARVEIKIKTTESGREFILVDLHPVDSSEKPTNRLVVLDDGHEHGESWEVFPAPNLEGYVALIGPDEKVGPKSPTFAKKLQTKKLQDQDLTPTEASFMDSSPGLHSAFSGLASLVK